MQWIPRPCPEFCLHLVAVSGETAQDAGKRASATRQRRSDRFAALTGETYLCLNTGLSHKKRYALDTNACDRQIECALLQKQVDNVNKQIWYWPDILNDRERSFDSTHWDCLAVVWSIFHLRPYLDVTHFTGRTHHHGLRCICNLADANRRLARWRLFLMEYDSNIIHRAGARHQVADALSRLNTKRTDDLT